jgi:hypothetical protein
MDRSNDARRPRPSVNAPRSFQSRSFRFTPSVAAGFPSVVRSSPKAGALGFSTSRTLNHRTSRGEYTPTLTAGADELVGIAQAIGQTGRGVLQVVSDFADVDAEFQVDGSPLPDTRLAAAQAGITVLHYSATQIKKVLTGNGRALATQAGEQIA